METNKGDAGPHRRWCCSTRRRARRRLVESDPLKRVDFGGGDVLRSHRRAGDDDLHRRQARGAISRTRRSKPTTNGCRSKLPGKEVGFGSRTDDEQLWVVIGAQRHRAGRDVPLRPQGEEAGLCSTAFARSCRANALAPMKAIRYKSSDGLEIPAYLTLPKGVPAKGLPRWSCSARRSVGARQLGLQSDGAVLRQSRLRGADAELPRLHRLRQEVPQRRQRRVGPEDAGRHHLGREVPGRARASPIRSASGSWAARTAATRRWPAWPSRRTCIAPAVDIVGPSNLITLLESIPPYWEAGRKMMYARMARSRARRRARAWLKERSPLNSARQDQDAADGGAGRQRSAREQGRGRSDRDRAARPRVSRWSTCSRRTRATASRGR